MALDHGSTKGYTLGASTDRVGRILDVCADDDSGFGGGRLAEEK